MATPYLEKAVKLVPFSRDAWTLKGLCHIGNGQRHLATEAYKTATSLPNAIDDDKLLLDELNSGKDLREIRSKMMFSKIDPLLALGDNRYSVNEKAKISVLFLKHLLEQEPNNQEFVYALAHARYMLGQYDKARPLLLHLNDITGGYAPAFSMLGLITKKTDNDVEAEQEYYKKALNIDPNHLLALVNLASSLQEQGEFHAARPLLIHAMEGDQSDENYPIALDLYGNNIGVVDEDYIAEAEYHAKAIELAPANHMFKSNQVIALLSAGKTKDARQAFMKHKRALQELVNYEVLSGLVEAYTKDFGHPYPYLQIVDQAHAILGWKAIRPLLHKAWNARNKLRADQDEVLGFFMHLGMCAGHAGDTELALEIWDQGSKMSDGEEFICNKAVELSSAGRHAEALSVAENMPMTTHRSYTILGNIRKNAGMHLAAIAAYEKALEHDDKFLLPITNAIFCISELRQPELLAPFSDSLVKGWPNSIEAKLTQARALLLAGKPRKATDLFGEILANEGIIISPDKLYELFNEDSEDLSIFGGPSDYYHKLFAKALILSGNYNTFEALNSQVANWPKWNDGDWKVFMSESLRNQGEIDEALEAINDMALQPPSLISSALCHMQKGDYDSAEKNALEALSCVDDPSAFSHIEGRPDSLATAVIALCKNNAGQLAEAKDLAISAISKDIGSAFARTTLASIYVDDGDIKLASQTIVEGLKRSPGHPRMVRFGVELLLEQNNIEEADELLSKNRDLLPEFGEVGLAEKLGELIALRKLEKATILEKRIEDICLDWAHPLDTDVQSWLVSAISIQRMEAELSDAFVLYLSKAAEKLLVSHIFKPFRASLSGQDDINCDRLEDLSRFIKGGRAPGLGGMSMALHLANRPFRSSDIGIIKSLRQFIRRQPKEVRTLFQDEGFLEKLKNLAYTRNAVAHTGVLDLPKLHQITSIILEHESPGILLRVFMKKLTVTKLN